MLREKTRDGLTECFSLAHCAFLAGAELLLLLLFAWLALL